MTSAVSIRLAGADDLDMIMNLVAAVSWPHRREDVAHAMALGHAWIAIAEDAQIVGVAMWWEYARAAARIGLVIVSPDHQGQGIGRRLMDQVLVDVGSRRRGSRHVLLPNADQCQARHHPQTCQ